MVVFDQESDSGYAIMNLDQYEDLLNDADWVAPDSGGDDDNFDPQEFMRNHDWGDTNLAGDEKAPWEEPWEKPWEEDSEDELTEEPVPEFTPPSNNLTTAEEPEWGSTVKEEKGDAEYHEIKMSDSFVPELSEEEITAPQPVPKNFSRRSGFEHIGSIASRKLNEVEPMVSDAGVLEEVSLADVPHEEETFLLEPVE